MWEALYVLISGVGFVFGLWLIVYFSHYGFTHIWYTYNYAKRFRKEWINAVFFATIFTLIPVISGIFICYTIIKYNFF